MYTLAGISGALRKASTNTGLLRCAEACCSEGDLAGRVQFVRCDLSDVPLYNGDVEAAGPPDSVKKLVENLKSADALILACPEYNYSIAPVLKNALDWASRAPENEALVGKPVIMFGAGGMAGTSRSQHHLRQVCVRLDLYPLNRPEGLFNAFQGGFDADGSVTDPEIAAQVKKQVHALVKVLESGGLFRR